MNNSSTSTGAKSEPNGVATGTTTASGSVLRDAKKLIAYPSGHPKNTGARASQPQPVTATSTVGASRISNTNTSSNLTPASSALLRDAKRQIHYPAARRSDASASTTPGSAVPTENDHTTNAPHHDFAAAPAQASEPIMTHHTVHATLVEEGTVDHDDEDYRQRIEEEVRNQFLQNAVVGEAVIAEEPGDYNKGDSSSAAKRRRVCLGISALILILAGAGVAVGVYLGTRDTGTTTNSSSSTATGSAPTTTQDVILLPSDDGMNATTTTTMAPTTSSGSNSTPSSPVPTAFMTDAPSVRPTWSNANRNNSIRDEAHFLELSGGVLSAPLSSLNLVEEYTVTCGQGISLELPTIGGWYVYSPRVAGPVTLIVCGNVVLEAFTGQE
ncbi:expressed unknown protein [Seminavis robusta]|uniref:Uncharacterized protein n=1 Tax=Seminavis robusta TaxID=568900 RepID=A0A9N8EHG5_9STRA|nr:expressed unknown protein [Seminavis robusta]|eukprot:Sro1175_g249100.1 n/a (384) ;mRNA; r:350-1501